MAQFGILPSFDHSSQSWQTYKCRIKQWFIANDLEAADKHVKKRAILLSALSDGTYKLASDLALPKQLETVPFEDIIKLLDDHFIPKTRGFGERYTFYAATQDLGETFTQWAARLRGLTANCKFLNVEEALRDRFMMGMLPGPEREKLFAQGVDELTLAKAIELAESIRNARAMTAAATSGHQGPAVGNQQLYKIGQSSRSVNVNNEPCKVCGFRNHISAECRYSKYKCKKCNEKGHLRRMCTKINFIENEGTLVDSDDNDDGELFNIRSVHGEPMTELILVQGVRMRFQLDSGSAVTVISEQTYKHNFADLPLSSTKKHLLTYTGSNIKCLGTLNLQFSYLNQTRSLKVYVICDGGPPLLGRDFISAFKLEMLPINFCEQSDIKNQLQSRYPSVFSKELGTFNQYKVKIHLKEDAKKTFFKPRPVAYALKDKITDEINRLVRVGILKPIQYAEYASPIVPVLKHNGDIRLCADYSVTLNKQLKVEQYPLPTAHELFAKLHGGEQFTKLDLSQAYAQIELEEESQALTCINTHRGLFKYTRLVFGLASAPAIFQRIIDSVLSGMEGVLFLLDDILVTGINRAQHTERLHMVLQKLQDVGLTLQQEKCEFFKDEIEYLGYVINKNGLKKSPKKVDAILGAPVPTNVTKLQSFLGLVNYYRNFVPNASSILSPLYSLLEKGKKWCWEDEHQKAFDTMKKCLTSDLVLAHFNQKAKVILTVDASPTGLGVILSQIDSTGIERPVAFASRTLNTAEKNYAQIQKEATAIIYGVRRFHQYLYGRAEPFVLRTDHKPLLTIFGPYRGIPEVTANRLQRYAMFLSAYNYTIEYVSSANNTADYLSRASLPERDDSCDALKDLQDRASYINFVTDNSLPITLSLLRAETEKDETLQQVITNIKNGWPRKINNPELQPFYLCRAELSYEEGCIMRGHKVVIPEKYIPYVLEELHKTHLGVVKCKSEARSRFWFPGIDKAIETKIASCHICAQLRPLPPKAPLAVWPYPPKPFYRIHVDFLGPLNGSTYLVIVDSFSKWVEVYPMSSLSTPSVLLKIQDFISRFGIPHTLVSDNGTAFVSKEFESFCRSNGIEHLTSPTYHPASNGQAESFVKIIKKSLKASLIANQNKDQINVNLMKYLFDYRNSVNTTTGSSPAELVFGSKLHSRLDLLVNPPSRSSESIPNHVRDQQCSQSEAYNGKNLQSFSPNDDVLYRQPNNNLNLWKRGIVIKKIGKVLYEIRDLATSTCYKKHKNQLLLYKGNDSNINTTSDIEYYDAICEDNNLDTDAHEPQLGERDGSLPPETSAEDSQTFTAPETAPAPGSADTTSIADTATVSVTADASAIAPAVPSGATAMLVDTVDPIASSENDVEEFHEASDTPEEQPRVRGSSRMLLRPLPKVNYKPFF